MDRRRIYVPLDSVVFAALGLLSVLVSLGWTDEGEPIKALIWLIPASVFLSAGLVRS